VTLAIASYRTVAPGVWGIHPAQRVPTPRRLVDSGPGAIIGASLMVTRVSLPFVNISTTQVIERRGPGKAVPRPWANGPAGPGDDRTSSHFRIFLIASFDFPIRDLRGTQFGFGVIVDKRDTPHQQSRRGPGYQGSGDPEWRTNALHGEGHRHG